MPLPLFGPISMSQFNTQLDWTGTPRAFDQANSRMSELFLSGSQPVPNNFNLDQNEPHLMSEWYGYTPCTQTPGSPTGIDYCNPPGEDPGYYLEYYNCDGTTYLVYDSPACP